MSHSINGPILVYEPRTCDHFASFSLVYVFSWIESPSINCPENLKIAIHDRPAAVESKLREVQLKVGNSAGSLNHKFIGR